jgi:hypothetical protein
MGWQRGSSRVAAIGSGSGKREDKDLTQRAQRKITEDTEKKRVGVDLSKIRVNKTRGVEILRAEGALRMTGAWQGADGVARGSEPT